MTIATKREGRLILLGIDSLDLPLTQHFAESGAMPNFASLLDNSPIVSLSEESTKPLPSAVWETLMTGVSPAVHGFIDGVRLRPLRPSERHFFSERFYKTLSEYGLRGAVVDAPVDYPIRPFKGIQVCDWGSEFWLWGFETEPRSLKQRLLATYGVHPLTSNPRVESDHESLKRLRRSLAHGLRLKARFIADLLAGPYDYLFLNYAELHKAGHYFWKFYDPTHPEHDPTDPELASALEYLHSVLDEALGELLGALNEKDNLIIISDRGIESNNRAHHLMEEALLRMGLLQRQESPAGKPHRRDGNLTLLGKARLRRLGRRLLPDGLQHLLRPWYRGAIGEPQPVDPDRTKVFFDASVGNSYLRINLKGRETTGVVDLDEYNTLLREIERELYALVNPVTGDPVIKKVYFPWRMYKGGQRDNLPDVSILWNAESKVDAIRSETIGVVAKPFVDKRSGNHTADAFLLCHGPAFISGQARLEADARQLSSTVFHLLGEAPPEHCERPALFDVLRRDQVVWSEPSRTSRASESGA